jgi:hypothetical protein
MYTHEAAKQYRTSDIIPPIIATSDDDVMNVIPLPGYRLAVIFHDGISGIVDMARLIAASEETAFAPLRDLVAFSQVKIVYGAVTWPGDIDLAPDAMHDALKENGEWVLSC